jgi:hypothetical protein
MNRFLLAVTTAALPAFTATAQDFLMVVDSGTDTVLKFNPTDGTPMGTFCTMPVTGGSATPKEALQVGTEVWVSDQLQDNIVAFDASGTLIGTVVGPAQGLDNVRGFEVADGKIWVTCGSGRYAGQLAVFDQATRGFLFAVPVGGSPFDCFDHRGEILVTNSTSHDVDRVAYDGTILGKFVDSSAADAPLDFPQQAARNLAGTEVLIAEFSSTEEVFRFDASTGALLQEIDTAPQGGIRGVFQLGDGRYLFTNGNGVHTWSPSGVTSLYSGSSCQYVGVYHVAPSCPADFNGDGFLDFFDYDDYVSCFETGTCPPGRTADFNGDGFADFFDYDDFVAAFERGC